MRAKQRHTSLRNCATEYKLLCALLLQLAAVGDYGVDNSNELKVTHQQQQLNFACQCPQK